MRTIDARGLPCPQPVILARNAMREGAAFTILVSAQEQVNNVRRLAEKAGWQTQVESREGEFAVQVHPGSETLPSQAEQNTSKTERPTVLVVSSERMGRGEEELGEILIRAFFHTLNEVDPLPNTIIFYNSGVKLAVEGSPILEDLQALETKGVEILVCGTCLGYFELKDRLAVGEISNMYSIAETLLSAGHIISP
ncbi:MAG: sulfurtransferase-like selenium metabolism protein YedF [Anaerolineae bacterium]|nr:sulfurtransferase-like selenium metabolism protein YedF [Anaerolineae bacterium]